MANFISAYFYYGEESFVASLLCHQITVCSWVCITFNMKRLLQLFYSRVLLEQQKKRVGINSRSLWILLLLTPKSINYYNHLTEFTFHVLYVLCVLCDARKTKEKILIERKVIMNTWSHITKCEGLIIHTLLRCNECGILNTDNRSNLESSKHCLLPQAKCTVYISGIGGIQKS